MHIPASTEPAICIHFIVVSWVGHTESV